MANTTLTSSWTRIKNLLAAAAMIVVLAGSGCELINNPPIVSISAEDESPITGSRQTLTAITEDLDEDPLRLTWRASAGKLSKTTGPEVQWEAPDDRGDVTITLIADDRKSGIDSASIVLMVVNNDPVITEFTSSSSFVLLGNAIDISVTAFDPDGENIAYSFFTSPPGVGEFVETALPNEVIWIAPTIDVSPFPRIYDLVVLAQDSSGFVATDTLGILVYAEYGTIWVIDSRHARASKYSSRGHLIFHSAHNFARPVAVTNNTMEFFGAYVADADANEVVKLDELGGKLLSYPNLPNVTDIALHRDSGTLWVLSLGDSSLAVINTFTDMEIKRVYGFSKPETITINQSSGDVWIADAGNHTVVQFDANQPTADLVASLPDIITSSNTTLFTGQFNTPVAIAMRNLIPPDATVFIADKRDQDGQIERLVYNSSLGQYQISARIDGYSSPSLLAATVEGLLWVANEAGTVLHFPIASNGLSPTSIVSYDFNSPSTMAADPINGTIWIGDNGTNEVISLVSPDSVDVVISGFGFIQDIIVNK